MKCEICGKTIDGWCWLKGNKGQCFTCHTNMDNSDDEENIEFEEEEHSEDDIAIGELTFIAEKSPFARWGMRGDIKI